MVSGYCYCSLAYAASEEAVDLFQLDLETQMDMTVSTFTKTDISVSDSPSSITLIPKSVIDLSGADDPSLTLGCSIKNLLDETPCETLLGIPCESTGRAFFFEAEYTWEDY